jgi:NAD+ synthase (glutamine-hydrolysing)
MINPGRYAVGVPVLRVALAQANPVVGDLTGNAAQVVGYAAAAAAAGADLLALPEMFLTGYPVEDLALRASFVAASQDALAALGPALAAAGAGDLVVVVGYLDRLTGEQVRLGRPHGSPQNAAAVLHQGAVIARYAKHHLPNYGVFDEFRYFVPGDAPCVVRVAGVDVALAICEDLWQDGGPVAGTRAAGAGLLLVINGSPYELDKDDVRLELCRRRAAEAGCTLAYLNMVGGQDELVFDGDSLVVTAGGTVVSRAPAFAEELVVVDLELPAADPARTVDAVVPGRTGRPAPTAPATSAAVAERLPADEQVYAAITLALRDYVRKNGFESVVIALSGGIDSALVAALACDALGAGNVHCVSMPSAYSSQHSRDDAADLARRTGCAYRTVEIAPMVDAYLGQLHLTGLAEENLQARVRGTALMGISNQEGHLVLATGNKSELAVGYSTIYGDAVGGFAPIKDVPKTLVWRLARWRNAEAHRRGETAPIPASSIDKPPSAELRPGQLDSDSLPEYAELDAVLDSYVEQDQGAAQLLAAGFDHTLVERVLRMTDAAEYKRRQYPPGPKISFKAFGRDRRLPVTNRWREQPTP